MTGRTDMKPWDQFDDRAPRKMETREQEQTVPAWQPSSELPDPDPRDGWVHRWVRVMLLGDDKSSAPHYAKMRKQGWEPCVASEYPELLLDLRTNEGSYVARGMIEVGGLLLCRLSAEGAKQRREYYARKSFSKDKNSAAGYMAENNNAVAQRTNMKVFADRSSQTSFGTGASPVPK